MIKEDTKYLIRKKGRTIYTIRYLIPSDVAHAFLDKNGKPKKEILQSTKTTDLHMAQLLRNKLVSHIELKIASIRTGDENLIAPLAQMYKKELEKITESTDDKSIEFIGGDGSIVGADVSDDLIEEIQHQVSDRVKELKLVDATPEEIQKAMSTPTGYISEEEALEKLDKTGRVKQFYAEILGHNFDAHLDHWETRRSKKVGASFMKQGRAHIRLFQKYHPPISGVTWKVVDDWIYELGNPEKGKPINSITIGGYLSSLRNYWNHVSRIIQDPNAKDLIAFKEHELPDSVHDIRKGWETEDLRRLYQEETITSKNTPLLKDLMFIAMFTGCRIEDACRLQRKDVVIKKGIRCLHINASKAKRFHNFGIRDTPIHSKLETTIDRLLSEIDDDPEAYLITIKTAEVGGKRSTALSKSFGYHKEALGYERKDTKSERAQELRDFHSIRTTGNSFLKNKKIEQTEREVIFGWSKSFKNASMAENNYNDREISYPYDQRKKDIELLTELYYWLD